MKRRVRNEEITSKTEKVYSVASAKNLFFRARKYTAKQLSRMKQENIRDGLEGKRFTLKDIKNTIEKVCGYCFVFWSGVKTCLKCPIRKRVGKRCFALPEWDEMERARTKAGFRKAHKAWCKKIGLDVYGKEKPKKRKEKKQ